MIYDDVANNEGNPFAGKVRVIARRRLRGTLSSLAPCLSHLAHSAPSPPSSQLFNTANGTDVYGGCDPDYTGMDVSMQTFFAVLEGNASGVRHGGRVLNSTENDNVFIIYTDHGAPGYVTFPSGPAMHAGDLNDALVRMHTAKRYKQALLYMDACNSGSMFASGLLKAPNLLAVTAATGEEESFAAFCPPFDRIAKENNRETFSCLGDIFTIGWILDDAGQVAGQVGGKAGDQAGETIGQQLAYLANRTVTARLPKPGSHVTVFGDVSLKALPISVFAGSSASASASPSSPLGGQRNYLNHGTPVSSRDVELVLARHRAASVASLADRRVAERELARVQTARRTADTSYAAVATSAAAAVAAVAAADVAVVASSAAAQQQHMSATAERWLHGAVSPAVFAQPAACYKGALAAAKIQCGPMDDYSIKYSRLLANMCGERLSLAAITAALDSGCVSPTGNDTKDKSAHVAGELASRYDLVSTPCGRRPRECVVEAPHGSVVHFAEDYHGEGGGEAMGEGGGFRVVHADGRVESVAVPESCHAFAAEMMGRTEERVGAKGEEREVRGGREGREGRGTQADNRASSTLTIPNGWIQSAGVYRMDPTDTVSEFVGQWPVPAAPKVPKKPETLYYFIGLEDRTQGKLTSIHQPVLTWGDETEGGRGGWHLWSWTCCPKNLTWHSPDIAIETGDLIYGSIEKKSPAVWEIKSAFKNATGWQNTTLTSQVGTYTFNYADVTLETYNVTDCSGMVGGSVGFTDLALTLASGKPWVPPTWYVTGQPNDCRTKLDILNASAMTITSSGGR